MEGCLVKLGCRNGGLEQNARKLHFHRQELGIHYNLDCLKLKEGTEIEGSCNVCGPFSE